MCFLCKGHWSRPLPTLLQLFHICWSRAWTIESQSANLFQIRRTLQLEINKIITTYHNFISHTHTKKSNLLCSGVAGHGSLCMILSRLGNVHGSFTNSKSFLNLQCSHGISLQRSTRHLFNICIRWVFETGDIFGHSPCSMIFNVSLKWIYTKWLKQIKIWNGPNKLTCTSFQRCRLLLMVFAPLQMQLSSPMS